MASASADVAEFSRDGITFKYPGNWTLERADTDDGWTVSVQSPGTAFWMLTLGVAYRWLNPQTPVV